MSTKTGERAAQRRPEHTPRQQAASGSVPSGAASPLNEGRSIRPGNSLVIHSASRSRCSRRSTKAGAYAPATVLSLQIRRVPPASMGRECNAATTSTLFDQIGPLQDREAARFGTETEGKRRTACGHWRGEA